MAKKTSARVRTKEASSGTSSWFGQSEGSGLKNISTILKLAAVVTSIVFAFVLSKHSQNAIVNLANADQKALKEAIFGDVPHLFFCDRGSPAKAIPSIFADLNQLRGSKMSFAILNCSQVLPSGKTIYERFKLKKEWKPTIWGIAPWAKPLQAGPSHMKDTNALKKFVDDHFAPRAAEVKSNKQLANACGFGSNADEPSTCVVLSKGSRFEKSHRDLEEHLVAAFPKTRFVSLDARKLRLSFEDVEDLPADAYAMRLHALRNGTHYLTMVNPTTWDYLHTFVATALASPIEDYLSTAPKGASGAAQSTAAPLPIKLVVPGQSPSKKAKKPATSRKAKPVNQDLGLDGDGLENGDNENTAGRSRPRSSSQRKAPPALSEEEAAARAALETAAAEAVAAEAKAAEAAARAEQIRREQMIRDQMDRMEREHLFVEEEEVEGADEGEGEESGSEELTEEESEEEELINL